MDGIGIRISAQTGLALIMMMLIGDGTGYGYISKTTAPLYVRVPVFEDSFETESNWQMFEEIVDGSPCYGSGIGSVTRSTDVAHDGLYSLLVWSNQALSPKSNHVIGYKLYSDFGQQGIWRYEVHAYISPTTVSTGQTGPEFSMQNTRLTATNSFSTSIAGIQYIANPYWETAQWKVWDNGSWTPFVTHTLQPGLWYTLTLEANFSNNTYKSFSVQGADSDLLVDLSSYHIAEESRGFGEAFVITLESENLWNNCGTAGNFEYKVYYDKLTLLQDVARVFLPMIMK